MPEMYEVLGSMETSARSSGWNREVEPAISFEKCAQELQESSRNHPYTVSRNVALKPTRFISNPETLEVIRNA
jgi:hypothetical protein